MESARQNFERTNAITEETMYIFDEAEQDRIQELEPWTKDIHYFKHVRISAVALIKMVMHARSGGNIEVMGLLQGKVIGNEMIVLDVFGLPVEGTETRVNAGASANEYMVNYITSAETIGKPENTIGWYHSHPGYNCWLSGIDVATQSLHQKVEDPYLAIVIDPIRTISTGKVEIGCFRTYPEGYNAPESDKSEYEHVPLSKIEDFGVHYNSYYTLTHSIFKSELDSHLFNLLWNKYWSKTLASSSLVNNYEYSTDTIVDLQQKVEQSESSAFRQGIFQAKKKEETKLQKVAKDAVKVGTQQGTGLAMLMMQNLIFRRQKLSG